MMTPQAKDLPLDREHTLFLVDISAFIFRAYHAIQRLTNSRGESINSVMGVASMLGKLVEEARPKYLSIVYDSKEPSFRKLRYAEYKANRVAPPDDLVPQFDWIEKLIHLMGLHGERRSGLEADDLLATATCKWIAKDPRNRVVLVTGDKDLMQLVSDRVVVWDTMADRVFTPEKVLEKFGVEAHQIRDYLALVGDSSDNIPGVKSIGPKTAVDLLTKFRTLPEVLQAAHRGEVPGKKGEALLAHESDALLSLELVTLKEDLPLEVESFAVPCPYQEGKITPPEECLKFLRELELPSLIRKWGGVARPMGEVGSEPAGSEVPPSVAVQGLPSPKFTGIHSKAEWASLVSKLQVVDAFAFDCETTSLNPREAKVVGIAFSLSSDEGYYVPLGHQGLLELPQLSLEEIREDLCALFVSPKLKIAQNLKFDWEILNLQGVQMKGPYFDTMVADYVLHSEGSHSLAEIAARKFGYSMLTYEEVCGKGASQIGFDQVPITTAIRYSAEDAWVTWNVWRAQIDELKQGTFYRVFTEMDLPLVEILGQMELHGIRVDTSYLSKLSTDFGREMEGLSTRIQAFSKRGPLNLNSPKQLQDFLFHELGLPTQGKTKTGYSTDASVLEVLAQLHEAPKLLLEYRELSKLKGTYVDPLPQMLDRRTGRLHTHFLQTRTATGRLASVDPNLQNIPIRTERGMKIRRAFIAEEGWELLSADYSQIELRILAHMSQDPVLVESFRRGEDVHRRTGAEIFNVAPENLTDSQRGVAKAINFGLMYGKTPFGLSQELGISVGQAKEMIDRYFLRYAGVKAFLDRLIDSARKNGQTQTLFGRVRKLPEIHAKNPALRANAERMAMNTPIQGTAADLMKLGMIRIHAALQDHKLDARMLLQVHDEVIVEVKEGQRGRIEPLVRESLEEAMKLEVPLVSNLAWGANWSEL